jgi:hypothetical protein
VDGEENGAWGALHDNREGKAMRRTTVITVVAALALVMAAATGALAAGNATVNVTASITGSCTFNTATATLAFGVLNPVAAPAVTTDTSAAPLQFTCTNNTLYTISDNRALAGNLTNGISLIPYTYAYGIPTNGTATGVLTDLPITANIAAGTYSAASAGAYTDTILVQINP